MQVAFGSSVLTHKKEQQIKIEGEFKPTVDCLCAIRRGFVAVYMKDEGISRRTAENTKKELAIRSYRKMRQWYWSMWSCC